LKQEKKVKKKDIDFQSIAVLLFILKDKEYIFHLLYLSLVNLFEWLEVRKEKSGNDIVLGLPLRTEQENTETKIK
jgi:hypothetical protein